MSDASAAQADLRALAEPERAAHAARFFQAHPGGYGEGDCFLGLTVPQVRSVARAHKTLSLDDIADLLASRYHEDRLLALVVLVERARKADAKARDALAAFYLRHLDRVNQWDLVDVSAPQILGPHFLTRSRAPLHQMARSGSVWHRRVAILTTFHFIREGENDETFAIARLLIHDAHDLIHKAVGWMLREAGKRDAAALRGFLDEHAATMPRTMLRYAIERLPPDERRDYLDARTRATQVT